RTSRPARSSPPATRGALGHRDLAAPGSPATSTSTPAAAARRSRSSSKASSAVTSSGRGDSDGPPAGSRSARIREDGRDTEHLRDNGSDRFQPHRNRRPGVRGLRRFVDDQANRPALWTTANRPGKWTRPLPGGRQEPCGPGQGGGPGRGGGGGAADEMVPHSSGHQTRRCRKSCLHLPGAPQRSQLTRGFPEPHRHQEVRSVSSYSVDNDDHPRTAAFFDLDKTIIAKSSTLAFSRSFYQGGLINRRAVLRSAYAQFV